MQQNQEWQQWIIAHRRHLHENPELSHQEQQTREYVKKQLEEMGIAVHTLTGKDVIGELVGAHPGKTVAVRADMDALPIQEETGLPFASKNPGVMHACGHDGHTAILLGVAKKLVSQKDKLHGKVRFVFQHAEEVVPGGAKELVENGLLEGVDAIFGLHLWQPLPNGLIGVTENAIMAGADQFEIEILGKGGHGAMPHETVDPTLVAAHLITQLHSIISRTLNPLDQAVLSIGELKAGSSYNVIPDKAVLSGTVRYFEPHVRERVKTRMQEIVDGVCRSFNATPRFTYVDGDPAVRNNAQLAALVKEAAEAVVGKERVVEAVPSLGGEDFAYYSQEIPAVFFFAGVGVPEYPYGHHHPKFDITEEMLPIGAEVLCEAVLRFGK